MKKEEKNGSYQFDIETILNEHNLFLRAIPDPLIISDYDGNIYFANSQACEMFVYKQHDLIKKSINMLISERFLKKYQTYIDQQHTQKKTTYISLRLHAKHKGGYEFPVDICSKYLQTKDKIYLISTIRPFLSNPINENEEIQVVKNLIEFEWLLEAIPDAIIIINGQGNIIYSNQLAQKMFGYAAEELENKSVEYLIPQRFVKNHKKVRQAYLKKPITRPMGGSSVNLYAKHKDNHDIPVDISLSPLHHNNELLVIASIRDIIQKKILEEKLMHIAEHDDLTGLLNRNTFVITLLQSIEINKQNGTIAAVCFLDLDDFKYINDNYGHMIGDRLLVMVTSRLKECIRETDPIARIGGDEFAFVLNNIAKKEDIIPIIEKIIHVFREPFKIDEHILTITCCIGVALYPQDGENSLLEKADSAMYVAKNAGKDDYHFFEENTK